MPTSRRPLALVTAALLFSVAAPASGDFVAITAHQYNAYSGPTLYHVIDLYASFNQPADRLLNVYDVDIELVGAVNTVFYNASVQGVAPASGLPMPVILDATAYAYDSFITIGSSQGELTNGTTGDPSYVDAEFVTLGSITGGGWYNLPPSNGNGDAGESGEVLLGRFTITNANWQTGARINATVSVGYISDSVTLFGTDDLIAYYAPPAVTPPATPEDQTGDGKADIVWRNGTTNDVRLWELNSIVLTSDTSIGATIPNSSWSIIGQGDVDGDGDHDLVLRDPNGQTTIWFIENGAYASSGTVGGTLASAWSCLSVADLNGDGRDDLLFRNSNTSALVAWLLDGNTRWYTINFGSPADLSFLATADLDGDGDKDIVWRNTTTNMAVAWMLDGLGDVTESNVGNTSPLPAAWSIIVAGDINGDGKEDLVWRNANNNNVNGWLMNGAFKASGGLIAASVALAWQPVASIDINGDGRDDIVWRNTNTTIANGWTMNGLVKQGGGTIAPTGLTWTSFTK
ncbi:MAG: VCBS repeat-containing protein [Phycisphaerae bacterium]|nr:VCBS repeat-containing protein [Phycisphaerae bacterium]